MADKTIHVATPKGGESVRHIQQTKEDRAEQMKQFKEQKKHEQSLKEERFAAIQERRKDKKPSSGGSGSGINIDVTSDS